MSNYYDGPPPTGPKRTKPTEAQMWLALEIMKMVDTDKRSYLTYEGAYDDTLHVAMKLMGDTDG